MPAERCPEGVIVDTVVANYFTVLGRFRLLAAILGGVVHVPKAVYDPEDEQIAEESAALSELEQGLRLHRRRAESEEEPILRRERSLSALPHFEALREHVNTGLLVPIELTNIELRIYAELRDRSYLQRYGRIAGLGRGEAAALAIAETRRMRLATDDEDCIKVARARDPAFEPLRIRKLLLLAVEQGLIGLPEARSIHLSTVAAGFWDRGRIEPSEKQNE